MPADAIARVVTAASAPLTKLIEVVASGVGMLYEPVRIRRRARAKGEAQLIQLRANQKVATLASRGASRVRRLETRRQQNLEAIVGHAARQLPAAVDPKPVDPDWMAEWVTGAHDVSNEQMRSLWGRILAGEIARGGSFSRRALAAVRVLSKQQADIFTQFCSFVWQIDGIACCIQDPNAWELMRRSNVDIGRMTLLRDIGLLSEESVGPVVRTFRFEERRQHVFVYFGSQARVVAPRPGLQLILAPLTLVGCELAPIAGAIRNDEYFNLCLAHLRANGLEVELQGN